MSHVWGDGDWFDVDPVPYESFGAGSNWVAWIAYNWRPLLILAALSALFIGLAGWTLEQWRQMREEKSQCWWDDLDDRQWCFTHHMGVEDHPWPR